MENKVSVKEARDGIAELVNRAAYGKERIVLTRHGKSVAAIVPMEDVETMEDLEDRYDIAEARRILAAGGPMIPWEELKAQLKKAERKKTAPAKKKAASRK